MPVDAAELVKALQAQAVMHLRAGDVAAAKSALERAARLGETALRDTAIAQAASVARDVAPALSARYTPRPDEDADPRNGPR